MPMITETSVRTFSSSDVGAPQLGASPVKGELMAVLKACLVTGYNATPVSTVSCSGNILTLTCANGHGLKKDHIIDISGASVAAFNGEFRVQSCTATTLNVYVPGASLPSTSGGTMSVKQASAGWSAPFENASTLVLKAARPVGSALDAFFRLSHAASNNSVMIRGFESMTDVDSGTDPFPTLSQRPTGAFISRSASGRFWYVFATNGLVLINTCPAVTGSHAADSALQMFGRLSALDDSLVLMAEPDSGPPYITPTAATSISVSSGCWRNRSRMAQPPVPIYSLGGGSFLTKPERDYVDRFPFPDPSTGRLNLASVLAVSGGGILGEVPPFLQLLHGGLIHGAELYDIEVRGSKRNLMTILAISGVSGCPASLAVDTVGPWGPGI